MFGDLRLEAREFIDLGDEVIVVTDLVGYGRETGADVRGRYVFLYEIRHGVIIRGREYATTDEALEAARLQR
jgi:ketosteroid isomerase-like protein